METWLRTANGNVHGSDVNYWEGAMAAAIFSLTFASRCGTLRAGLSGEPNGPW